MRTSYQQLLQEAYDQKRAGKKKQLQAAYDRELAEITGLEQAADRQARESATRRSTQARQDKAAWNEIQTAQGLTSGAQGQALLTMDNQLRGDLTAISQAGNAEAAELAARRQALARDLAAQLEQVQAESDYEEAMALYQLSREQDSQQAQTQKAMAALLAQAGDFSLYGARNGHTQAQIRRLESHSRAQQAQ